MSKDENKDDFFAQHLAIWNRTPLRAIEGMPALFVRRLSARELSQCCDRKENGELELNLTRYAIACIVTEDGQPRFR